MGLKKKANFVSHFDTAHELLIPLMCEGGDENPEFPDWQLQQHFFRASKSNHALEPF